MFKFGEHGDVVAAGTKAEATGWRGMGERIEGWGLGDFEHSIVMPAIADLRNMLFYRFSSPEAEHNVNISTLVRSG